eukprot:gb/GECG01002885.1/.p1 GENE.gb/GECG01002885.1/~~gb/GECG01002885.1/.p1  ORF type:complete len:379 (+),score=24.68 gb/GECG01002885.1/:1-1137(+)
MMTGTEGESAVTQQQVPHDAESASHQWETTRSSTAQTTGDTASYQEARRKKRICYRNRLAWVIYLVLFFLHALPLWFGLVQDLQQQSHYVLLTWLYVSLVLLLLLQITLQFFVEPGTIAIVEDGSVWSTPDMDRLRREQCEFYGVDPRPALWKAISPQNSFDEATRAKVTENYPLRSELLRMFADPQDRRNAYSLYLARFDHWCPWINQAVAWNNHRLFFCFLVTALSHVLSAALCLLYHPLFWAMWKHGVRRFPYGPFIVSQRLAVYTLCALVALFLILSIWSLMNDQLDGIKSDFTMVECGHERKYVFKHMSRRRTWTDTYRNWLVFLAHNSVLERLVCGGYLKSHVSKHVAEKKRHWNNVASAYAEEIKKWHSST